ncbi:MAG TPA: enoyl-CoA hydratase-related protein [Novosphingobium sp.]|nr:enoyl-CoA hydratase-related protein [Novosphingobium sp.]
MDWEMVEGNYDYSRYSGLLLNKRDGVMTITLSNPGRRNATTPVISNELTTIWDDVWQDDEVKVIILQGEGKDFCAGADTNRLAKQGDVPSPLFGMTRKAKKHAMSIIDCEKPVIAKVRGHAYGVGLTLALAADLVYASEDARFCDPHVKLGMVAGDGGVLLWPAMGAFRRAKEALLLGEAISAADAMELGLINRVLPDDQLDEHVASIARRLCDMPSHAVNYTKVSLNVALKQMTGAAFETSIAYQAYSMKMGDFKEATKAFAEKRKGNFEGK